MATVLVVDDEADIRAALRGVLGDEGYRVLEAADGREALELLRAEAPELVLLDVWMPEVDGIELLRRLREDARPPQVIMISGHGNIETAVQATKLGAFDFIEKPLSIDAVLHAVERGLAHRAQLADETTPPGTASAGVVASVDSVAQARRHQRTIQRSVVASGHGLHSGVKSGLILHPLPGGSGIVFANLSNDVRIPATVDHVESTGYATTLHRAGMSVRTVEHLLATVHAYGITNLLVKVQSEVPVLDGSAVGFCTLLDDAGVEEQEPRVDELVIDRRVMVGSDDDGEPGIRAEPADDLVVHYVLRYPPPVGEQEYTYVHRGAESFRAEIAPARTFGFLKDMKAMAAVGLASGGRLDNCILIDDERVVNTELRFPDELARHKVLDLLGDLYLLGRPLRGRITARMTGHSDNIALVRALRAECGA